MNIKLIAGLGNPGKKYTKTRHNAGFIAVDIYNQELLSLGFSTKVDWKLDKDGTFLYTKLSKEMQTIILIKPQTFMNLSGKALQRAKDMFYVKDNASILIISDELDITNGQFKLTREKYSKTHNGIASIIGTIGKGEYFLRLGVDNRRNHEISGDEYVLFPLKQDEFNTLILAIRSAFPSVLQQFIND